MFRHVVMARWTETATEEEKQALRDRLLALPDQIPEVRSYRIGDDAGFSPDNFDIVVVADFDDSAGFLTYRDHPAHQKLVTELLRPIMAARAAVQHEWHTSLAPDLPA
ncbi:MAG TPA: Dabb family protein [Acidimicrobiia bacterium]|nr:Dabb family protein [Acidimicrobiia bacterium]